MIVAGVHGGYEWNTIALADELIEYLTAHPDAIPLNTRLYILRSLNPDGEMRSHSFDGRANDNGVDINRNFPAYWQATWPREGCWDHGSISAGEFSASEPETAALINFIETHPIDALLSLHSAALGIFPGGRPPDSASIDLAQTIAAASPYPYPPIDLGCLMTGQMADWASLNGIAAVDVELSNHTETDFDINLAILSAFLNWQR
jgi:predicted deacylase